MTAIEEALKKHIYELEQKLELTDYQIKKETEELKKIHKLQITDLEAKLTESEKQRQHLKDWLDDEILTSVDHESYYATINEYEEEVKQLKQQLAEKDEEAQEIYEMYNQERKKNWLYNRKNQGKNSFCIERLEKVLNLVDGRTYVAQYLKDQIEELKKENHNEEV